MDINTKTQNIIGDKYFEMSNHLGNVLQVVSDRKLPVPDVNGNIDYFLADVVSYSDYYPYGMQLQGEKRLRELKEDGSIEYIVAHRSGDYRYGFQNQEVDNEIKGKGNSVNYKFRMHDPRVGRFFAVDPLASDYPHNSPYAFSENVVINAVELEGLELKYVNEENELIFEINIDVPLKVFKVNDSDIFQEFVSEVFNLVLNDNLSTGNVEKLNDGSHRVKVNGNLSEGFGSAGEKVAYNWGYESANKPRTGTEDANLSLNPDTQDMAVAYRVGLRNGLHDKEAEEIIKSAKNQQSEVTVEKDFIAVKIDDVIYNFEVLKKNKDGDWEKTKSFDNQNKTTKPVENTVPYTK